jgi:hypothetical protein
MAIHDHKSFSATRPAEPLAAFQRMLTTLAANPPHLISPFCNADAEDLDARSDHIDAVVAAFSTYLATVLDDTSASTSGGIGAAKLDWLLANLADIGADAAGMCSVAADNLRMYDH